MALFTPLLAAVAHLGRRSMSAPVSAAVGELADEFPTFRMTQAPFGAWPSKLSTDTLLASSISLSDVVVTPGGGIAWLEGRATEKGRNAIVYRSGGGKGETEVIPDHKSNARSRVQEYGGASLAAVGENLIFSDFAGPLYSVAPGGSTPKQISPKSDVHRFADFSAHPQHSHLIVSILEDHTNPSPADVTTSIVLLNIIKQSIVYITQPERSAFFASPRFSAKGDAIAYVSWVHPNMPWAASSLYTKSVSKDLVFGEAVVKVAGGADESISQPRWEDDGDRLLFLSDRTGYYELYSWAKGVVELVLEQPTGTDVGGPDWMLGQSTHASLSKSNWISIASDGDLRLINLDSRQSSIIKTPFSSISVIRNIDSERVAIIGASPTSVDELAILRLSDGAVETVKKTSSVEVEKESISVARSIEFPAKDGTTSHAYLYMPTNKGYVGEESTLPPLIVHCHGGPTSAAKSSLNLGIQYFTTRGFAYVDVNYGGSTGYGRAFRKRLDGRWGVVDVDDTISAVEYFVKQKLVDPKRVSIVGGSAGGFTVLAALCDSKVFGAGVSQYGISDLRALAGETHKFESQYLFSLVGGTFEEIPETYKTRSPINKADKITAPLLLLQGSDDMVVPLAQATEMKEMVEKAGGDCELIVYQGEGHGFRRADSKKSALEAELAFYRKCFGIVGGN